MMNGNAAVARKVTETTTYGCGVPGLEHEHRSREDAEACIRRDERARARAEFERPVTTAEIDAVEAEIRATARNGADVPDFTALLFPKDYRPLVLRLARDWRALRERLAGIARQADGGIARGVFEGSAATYATTIKLLAESGLRVADAEPVADSLTNVEWGPYLCVGCGQDVQLNVAHGCERPRVGALLEDGV